ncbi:VOC family protein [Clostridium porci]|uniref:VOC family protein n=1 Tax=Clostridium porci TaxID=2605778 RepID=A0A7X2NMU1_9CLOT|nr:VOC family protein [Clostridium porci]MCI7181172.1 VOC family protein [Lachnospiraceae bacterium]MSS37737.1 VOC family protein [Clostridium porci]
MDIKKIVGQSKFAQVGFVVNDIEKTKKQFAILFGCEEPPTCDCGTFDITQTKIYDRPAPDAACVMAFFDMSPGVQLELIQPNEAPSVWRDHLNKYGEGIHHIAFQVENADETSRRLQEELGAEFEQEGNYGDGSGKYVYLQLKDNLKCRLELLQSFN